MAFNGSGLFTRLYNWVNDAANSINVKADRMDAEMDGFAAGLSNCLTRDGQGKPSTAIDWNNQNLNNVNIASVNTLTVNTAANVPDAPDGDNDSSAANTKFVQRASAILGATVQNSSSISAIAGGTADALTGAFAPAITALSAGMTVLVRAASANATATPTFQANATAAKTIVKGNNLPLIAGDIAGAGHWLELTYDLTLDRYVLANPAGGIVAASQTAQGTAKIATQALTDAGTDDATFITPKKLRNGFAISLGANGYIAFPTWLGGFIIQWVNAASQNVPANSFVTGTAITWPTTFPTTCRVAFGCAATNQCTVGISGTSATSVTPYIGNLATSTARDIFPIIIGFGN